MKLTTDQKEIKFTTDQRKKICREAIWNVYEKKCFYSGKEIEIIEKLTLDHVIPKKPKLKDGTKANMAFLRKEYDLPDNFNIEGLENLVPCIQHINRDKWNIIDERIKDYLIVTRQKKPIIEKEIERLKVKRGFDCGLSMVKPHASNNTTNLNNTINLVEEAYNFLLDDNLTFSNGKRVYIGKIEYPAPHDIQQSCCISFKFLKLRGLSLSLTHSEILQYLAFAKKTDPTDLLRKFVTGPSNISLEPHRPQQYIFKTSNFKT